MIKYRWMYRGVLVLDDLELVPRWRPPPRRVLRLHRDGDGAPRAVGGHDERRRHLLSARRVGRPLLGRALVAARAHAEQRRLALPPHASHVHLVLHHHAERSRLPTEASPEACARLRGRVRDAVRDTVRDVVR